VNQFLGDGVMALFGAPLAHEDHARRAALAALGLLRATSERPLELATGKAPTAERHRTSIARSCVRKLLIGFRSIGHALTAATRSISARSSTMSPGRASERSNSTRPSG